MPRKKRPVPKIEVTELEWWDKEVEGIQLRFVIKRDTRGPTRSPLTGE